MTFITVSQGGPSADTDIPDGVYPVILTELKDPRTVTARRGPKAGQDIDLIDWVFTIDAPGTPVHERPLDGSTSTSSGPRSKMYAWLTALLGGRPPAPQQQFAKSDLVGRMALATVSHDEGGWPQIASLGAMPASMIGQRLAAATGLPAAEPAPAPVAAPAVPAPAPALVGAAANSDDLPF